MRTIWSVSEGSYSDYRVIALFDIQAEAEACAALHKQLNPKSRDEWEVEEFQCVAAGEPFMSPQWKVRAILTPSAVSAELTQPGSWFATEPTRIRADEWVRTNKFDWEGHRGTVILEVPETVLEIEGPDQQGVRQSFSDRCARYKAETGAVWPIPDLQWVKP